MIQYAEPCLAMLIALITIWNWRAAMRADHAAEILRLRRSTDLLLAHANALGAFLDSSEAPVALKRLLIDFSDAIADRRVVLLVAKRIPSFDWADESAVSDDLAYELKALRRTNADLFDDFITSITTGLFAAVLRWPETAILFETLSARLAASPRRDMRMVVTVSHFRKADLPFASPDTRAAMA